MGTAQLRKELKKASPSRKWAGAVDKMRDDDVIRICKRLHDRKRKGR